MDDQVDEKKQPLLDSFSLEYISEEPSTKDSEFYVGTYDELCEEQALINKVIPVTKTTSKCLINIFLNIVTAGIWSLITTWYPNLRLYTEYSIVSLRKADEICIYGKDDKIYYEKLELLTLPKITGSHLKENYKNMLKIRNILIFKYKLFNYFFDPMTLDFNAFNFKLNCTYQEIHNNFLSGLNSKESEYQTKLYGECDLNFEVDTALQLLYKEFADPFYLFQVFSIILWMSNSYEKYATVILLTTILSLAIAVVETRNNLLSIQKMAKYSCEVSKITFVEKNEEKGGNADSESLTKEKSDISEKTGKGKTNKLGAKSDREFVNVSSTTLVPGDVFEIPEQDLTMPCEAILVSGSVIINESMLTGESTPIIKAHIPHISQKFDNKKDHKYILFARTKVIQKRSIGGEKFMV